LRFAFRNFPIPLEPTPLLYISPIYRLPASP
jgi:hypothetical protein